MIEDILMLAGLALCALAVVMGVVQLARTEPPRGAAILLVLGVAVLLGSVILGGAVPSIEAVTGAVTRLSGR